VVSIINVRGGGEGGGVPTLTWLPQYSHLVISSPGLGAKGAPQLGHFTSFAPRDIKA